MSEKIRRDASLALTGAEYVREKLVALAGLGPNSLYEQVYAIKVRVKSLDSLVDKVKEKRKTKKYSAHDATDLVGMRLLCVYAEDLPEATRSLVRFLRFCQSPEVKLFAGEDLSEAIREIIVYKSTRNARVYDSVFRYCKELPGIAHEDSGTHLALVEHEGDEKSYSSIHFVCRGISYASGSPKEVPVEIQIRTVFEDTWGEIDHNLEYKMRQKLSRPLRKDLIPVHSNYRSLLNNLKGHLEDAGALAESVRNGYKYLYDALGQKKSPQTKLRFKRIFFGDSFEKAVPQEVLDQTFGKCGLDDVKSRAKKLRAMVESGVSGRVQADEAIKELDIQTEKLRGLLKLLPEPGQLTEGHQEERLIGDIFYFLNMEVAICHIWKAQILKAFFPLSVHDTIGLLEEARDIYFKLERDRRFTSDSMLNFRLGCTMEELGKPEFGEFFLQRAIDALDEDSSLTDSIFQVIIPHYFGLVAWRKRASLLDLGIKSKNPRINRNDQKEIVLDALYFSLFARFKLFNMQNIGEGDFQRIEYVVANNIVSYAWEVFDLSSNVATALEDLGELVDSLRNELGGYQPSSLQEIARPIMDAEAAMDDAAYHDTMMKLYQILGDGEKVALHKDKAYAMMEAEGLQRKEGLNELYWYAQDRVEPSEVRRGMADHLRL
ncbi:MAG: hypothetical protein ACP5EN_02525 [Rhodovulum sp.]